MTKPVWEGPCRGGPLDGEDGQARYPKGFLLVDKVNQRAWVYDWDAEADEFLCRHPAGVDLDDAGRKRAAEEFTYDVRAVS
jgi:hypothetical protein